MTAWGWPQWTILGLLLVSIWGAAALNGKPKTGEYNGVITLIVVVGEAAILWAGGFWS